MVRIRRLQEKDVREISRWPAYAGDMAQMDYALREDGWLREFAGGTDVFSFAAEDDGELVGFTILARTGEDEAEFRIALRADRTGRGFGEPIAAQTLQAGFTALGFRTIHLIVRKNNSRGLALYGRLGFRDRGECRKEIRGEPVEFRIMEITGDGFLREKPH